jgi:hypothetical protein
MEEAQFGVDFRMLLTGRSCCDILASQEIHTSELGFGSLLLPG